MTNFPLRTFCESANSAGFVSFLLRGSKANLHLSHVMLDVPEAALKGLLIEGKDFMQVFLHWTISVSQILASLVYPCDKGSWSLPSL